MIFVSVESHYATFYYHVSIASKALISRRLATIYPWPTGGQTDDNRTIDDDVFRHGCTTWGPIINELYTYEEAAKVYYFVCTLAASYI